VYKSLVVFINIIFQKQLVLSAQIRLIMLLRGIALVGSESLGFALVIEIHQFAKLLGRVFERGVAANGCHFVGDIFGGLLDASFGLGEGLIFSSLGALDAWSVSRIGH